MIVILNNGIKVKVLPETAKMISEKINRPSGAKQWQSFHEGENGAVVCMFNLSEVSAIVNEENIIQ